MKKKSSKQILKKTIAVSTSAVMATTTVVGTMPLQILANDNGVVSVLENETKIENSDIRNIKVRSIADFDSNTKLEYLTDGNTDTYVDSNYINYDENLQYYQFELNKQTNINHIRIHPRVNSTNGRPNHYKLYAGTAEDNMSVVCEGDVDITSTDWIDIMLNQPVNANFVKVEVTADDADYNANHVITVSEIELYKTEEAEQVKDVYAVSGYQAEDGKVYLELNAKPSKIADPHWVYQEIDGKHYAVSDAAVEKLTYDSVCIYGAEDTSYWNYVYVNENGDVDVSTTYNLQSPTYSLKVGDEEVQIDDDDDLTIKQTFTDVPIVHVEGVNLNSVTVQRSGNTAVNIDVTGNHRSVDVPLIYNSKGQTQSGKYTVSFEYGSNRVDYLPYIQITISDTGIKARAALKDKVKETESLVEGDYTADSWKDLQSALEKANEVLDNNIATKTNIDQTTVSLQNAIDGLVKAPTIDKTKLKEKIDAYKDFTSDNDKFEIFSKTLTKAQEVYNDPNAIQEDVDYYARNLEAHYYLVKVAELNATYNYKSGSMDYSQYTTESITPVIRMYGITKDRLSDRYTENEETEGQMKGWYEEYQNAVKGLTKIAEEDKYIGFNEESDNSSRRQGAFSDVKEESVVVDGERQTKVTVRFNNNGLHPIYGESRPNASGETKYEPFNIGNDNYDQARLLYFDENFQQKGSIPLEDYKKLDGSDYWYDGFTASCILDSDAAYVSFYYYDGVSYKTYSPWFYRLDKTVDKSNLQTLVDDVKDYKANTQMYKDFFVPALENAQAILAKEDATQDEVDAAYEELDKSYVRCQIHDLWFDYAAFDSYETYENYTTETSLVVVSTMNKAEEKAQANNLTAKEYKDILNDLNAKIDALKTVEDGQVNVTKGITKEAYRNKKNAGYFEVTDEEKGDKVVLHVKYHNDGINHITNEETGKLDLSSTDKFMMGVNSEYYDHEEGTSYGIHAFVDEKDLKPLDGQSDFSEGFQFDYEVHPGKVNFYIKVNNGITHLADSYGTYLTDTDKKAPEVASIYEMEDGRIHVEFSEPVTIEDPNWEKSDLKAEIDGRFWIGTLTEDKVYEVKVKDFPGNEATFTVDHKSPIVSSVSYSITKPTNDKVKVTVNFDEYVSVADTEQNPGWKYNVEHTIATKEYTENTDEPVTFEDQTGNEVTVPIHIANIDKIAPTVTVKDSSVGEKNHYGKLDLKLYDASGIDYVVVNGEKKDLSNNVWSDLNDDSVNYKEGENTVEVYDVAGNKTVYTFDYDKTGPTITVKDSSVGEKNHYGKLDLKLYDASGIDYVVVNGEKRDLSNNVWSDLNDDSVNYKEGENTVEVYDVCGNKTVFTFDYDKTGPAVTVKDSSTGSEGNFSKLDLKLHDASGIDYVVVNGEKRDLSNNAWSDLNDDSVNYKEGENTVEVYDVCGNKTEYSFTYDTTAPVINAENKTVKKGTDFDPMNGVTATDQGKDITERVAVEKNEVNTKKTGTYEISYSVQDKAGNASEKTIQVTVERESLWDHFVDEVKDITHKVIKAIDDFFDWLF